MKANKEEKEAAIQRLREWLKPGDTVFCILRHVSRSGMFRVIDLVVFDKKTGQDYHLGYNAALAMGDGYDRKREGVRISGCGMDMGFALVYNLGATLWPDEKENRKFKYHTGRNGDKGPETSGGYFLKHRWM